jgi:hypothetical protein
MLHAWGGDRCFRGFGGEAEGKRSLGKPRHRWECNIKMGFKEIYIDG